MNEHAPERGPVPVNTGPALLVECLAKAILLSVGLAAVFIALSVCYEVVVRSLFSRPVIWVEEITSYLVGYITFVGMGAALYRGAHVGIEFLTDRLNGTPLLLVRLLADVLMLALALLLLDMSWGYWFDAWNSGERSTSLLSVPLWIPYLCFLAGSVVFCLVQVLMTFEGLRGGHRHTMATGEPT